MGEDRRPASEKPAPAKTASKRTVEDPRDDLRGRLVEQRAQVQKYHATKIPAKPHRKPTSR